ncbi:MAG: hypothetical protein ABFQ95_02235 [Pseudomonadota bacterium]
MRVFKPENEINERGIVSDTTKKFGTRGDAQRFITLKDNTKWVGSKDGLQRFLGALYLKKAINNHRPENTSVSKFRAVETKFMIKGQPKNITIKIKKSKDNPLKNIFTINSDNFISFSRFVGDHKPTDADLLRLGVDFSGKYALTYTNGYSDFVQNTNLRIASKDNKVTVIDTEYSSFRNINNKVKAPSQKTESEIGGSTFTFPVTDFK